MREPADRHPAGRGTPVSPADALRLRTARTGDHPAVGARVRRWWGHLSPEQSRELSLLVPKLFLQFFSRTSLVLEDDSGIRAFLIGFHSADDDTGAYIHFVGVDPLLRRQGAARRLYTTFLARAAAAGRTEVRAVTSPVNTRSVAFHRAMGFTLEPGDREQDGLPVHSDYDGPGLHRICFLRSVSPAGPVPNSVPGSVPDV